MFGPLDEPTVEASAAARAAGIPRRRLLGWVEREVFVPSVSAPGRGARRKFTRRDVIALAIIAELQALLGPHLRPGVIAEAVAEAMQGFGIGGVKTYIMITIEHGRLSTRPGDEQSLTHHVKKRLLTLVVNVAQVVQRVDAMLPLH